MNERTNAQAAVGVDERREHDRVAGPFDGLRINALETPVRIYDLSEGGCFVNSLHDQQPDVSVGIKMDLPYEGWIALTARTLYRKPGFGFAVCFTGMSDETLTRLRRAIDHLKGRAEEDAGANRGAYSR